MHSLLNERNKMEEFFCEAIIFNKINKNLLFFNPSFVDKVKLCNFKHVVWARRLE